MTSTKPLQIGVFGGTPLAAFEANATFLFENAALAPKTAELYAAFNRFFASDKLWCVFSADVRRQAMVREMWNTVAKAVPLSSLIERRINATFGSVSPFASSEADAWPERPEIGCSLALVCCLGELQEELQARPDILAKPLPVDVAVEIDCSTCVSPTLRELFGMVFGHTLVRSDVDPRLTGVCLGQSIDTLVLLAAALEGESPPLSSGNIRAICRPEVTLILPVGAVITAGQRAYAAYAARARAVEGLKLY